MIKSMKLGNYYYTYVSRNTYTYKSFLDNFKRAQEKNNDNLYKVYNTFSERKYNALNACKKLSEQAILNGYKVITPHYITSANTSIFSCACVVEHNNHKYLLYYTKSNNYILPL